MCHIKLLANGALFFFKSHGIFVQVYSNIHLIWNVFHFAFIATTFIMYAESKTSVTSNELGIKICFNLQLH